MPNLLVHIGVQGGISRALDRRVASSWILIALLLPDLPWILQRALRASPLPLDPLDLRLYAAAQASLAVTLLLCAAIALLGSRHRPGALFVLLAGNAAAHLLLDAAEIKWGNGVHLAAPFSWEMVSYGVVWPEAPVVYGLSALGVAMLLLMWRRADARKARRPRPARAAVASILLCAYFVAPWLAAPALEAEDAHDVATLRSQQRIGRQVTFDRVRLEMNGGAGRLHTFAGAFDLTDDAGRVSAAETGPGQVSVRGRFVGPHTIRLLEVHHHDPLRDLLSYAGLLGMALVIGTQLLRSAPGRHAITQRVVAASSATGSRSGPARS